MSHRRIAAALLVPLCPAGDFEGTEVRDASIVLPVQERRAVRVR